MTTEEHFIQAIDIGGADADEFLQGQLTQDIDTIESSQPSFAAWVNPRGRVIVIFDVLRQEDGYRLFLPADLAAAVKTRLEMFRLRAAVTIDAVPGPVFAAVANAERELQSSSANIVVRQLKSDPLVSEMFSSAASDRPAMPTPETGLGKIDWLYARFQAGIPWIDTETREQFTAHHLNLDLLNAINFSKGCYSGQEIIARTENLGRVKRRLCGLTADTSESVSPDDAIFADERKLGQIVCAARPTWAKHWQLLALLPVDNRPPKLNLSDGSPLMPT